MRKVLAVFIAVAGFIGFTAVAQAGCGHDLDVADTSGTTVATDTATTPIVTDQSGG